MKKILALLLTVGMVLGLFAGCGNSNTTPAGTAAAANPTAANPTAAAAADSLDGTYDITVWVSEMAGVKELTEQQIKDFMEEMGILSYEDLEDEDFTTLGGLAMFLLGGIPKAGDIFTYKNLQFEVVDMDRGRVDKLLVIKRDEEA